MTRQSLLLTLPGQFVIEPELRVQPTAQRASPTANVGWRYRRRYTITNTGANPVSQYPYALDLGLTNALVSGGKALSSGNDLRAWIDGQEVARTLVDWNSGSSATLAWLVLPYLGAGEARVVEVVYGNSAAGTPPTLTGGVDLPIFDVQTAGANRSTNAKWVYAVNRSVANAGKGAWYLTSGTTEPDVKFGLPGSWQPVTTMPSSDDRRQSRSNTYVSSGTKYQSRFDAKRQRAGTMTQTENTGADGVGIRVPSGIASVRCDLRLVNLQIGDTDVTPVGQLVILTRNSEAETWKVLFSDSSLQAVEATIALATYTPAATVNEVAFAVWPYSGGNIAVAARADRYVFGSWYATLELNLAATITHALTTAEVEVYELATELRYGGGALSVGVPPYKSILLGNAKSASGVGTPRLAVELNQYVVVKTADRKAEVWNSGLTAKVEDVPIPAVGAVEGVTDALTGALVERTSPDWMPLLPVVNPLTNPSADADATAWTPALLSPRGWWKADALVGTYADGARVPSWTDSSGNGKHAANGLTLEQPIFRANAGGYPAVQFDGVDEDLSVPGLDLSKPCSVFVVLNTPADTTADQRVYTGAGGTAILRLHTTSAGTAKMNAGADLQYASDVGTGAWEIHANIYAADTTNSRGSKNGGAPTTGNAGTASIASTTLVIGSAGGTSLWADMYLRELIVFPGLLSLADAANVVGYLAHKYAMTSVLPAGHPHKTDPPTTDVGGWVAGSVSGGVTRTTIEGASDFFDTTPGAFTVTIIANTAAANAISESVAADYVPVGDRSAVWVGMAIRTTNTNVQPRLNILFYDKDQVFISQTLQSAVAIPAADAWYRRIHAVAVPVGAVYFRVALRAVMLTAGATGQYWWDTVAVNDADVGLLDVSKGTVALSAAWTNRHAA